MQLSPRDDPWEWCGSIHLGESDFNIGTDQSVTRVTDLFKIWLVYQDGHFLTPHLLEITHLWCTSCDWNDRPCDGPFWLTWDFDAPVRQFYDWPFCFFDGTGVTKKRNDPPMMHLSGVKRWRVIISA